MNRVDVESMNKKLESLAIRDHSYYIMQYNGQRIFKVKDDPDVPPPPRGTEIFVGKLPRDYFEDQLVPLFEEIGPIYKLRLMVDFNGRNRGYAFVTYFTVDNARSAVKKYHNFEIRKGCKIGVYKSVDNCRLFVGNLPKDKTKEEIIKELSPYVEDLTDVILYKSLEDPSLNRGFAFLEFGNHRSAAMTRRKLAPGTFFMWGQSILVDWADPLPDVDPNIMAKVKKIYMRNLNPQMTPENLRFRLCEVLSTYASKIVKVHKSLDYAFIHFATRLTAEIALHILQENASMFGEEIEVTWARPKIYSKENRIFYFPETFCTSLPPQARRLVHMRNELVRARNYREPNQLPLIYNQENLQAYCIYPNDINYNNYSTMMLTGNQGLSLTDV